MDLCRRFHEAGWQVRYYPEACAIHAGGASSANAPIRFFLELQKANLHYWTKHHGRAGRLFFLANTFIHHLLRLLPGVIIYVVLPPRRNTISQKIKRSAACMKWIIHDTSRSGLT
jgi:GT2 family glycosyltransferase